MNMQRQWPRNVQAWPEGRLRVGDETFTGEAVVVRTQDRLRLRADGRVTIRVPVAI